MLQLSISKVRKFKPNIYPTVSSKIVSEYDQEIPQSQTTDKAMASLGRADKTQQSRDTRKTNKAKQPALCSPRFEKIAKIEWTQRNAQQNIEQLQNPTMAVTINNETTASERTAAKATAEGVGGGGGLNAFFWYQIFALDFAVVEAQKMLSSYGEFQTIAMYHHIEKNNQINAL